RRTGAYDEQAGRGLRLHTLPEVAGGGGRRKEAARADRSHDQGEGTRPSGRAADVRPRGDDNGDGEPDPRPGAPTRILAGPPAVQRSVAYITAEPTSATTASTNRMYCRTASASRGASVAVVMS